ncbi:MAG: hypothetical protein Q7J24_15060 [Desulfomicrobium sp.]|nr:hypothetical protein [Desulfomicrobium sp.]
MKKDEVVIRKFLCYLRSINVIDNCEPRFPDKKNRTTKDIDCTCANIAIEHTSIDILKDRRKNSAYVKKFLNHLEKKLLCLELNNLTITIQDNLITKNHDWEDIAKILVAGILINIETIRTKKIQKINYKSYIYYAKQNTANKNILKISSSKYDYNNISDQLFDKCLKLNKYANKNKILLIENYDDSLQQLEVIEDMLFRSLDKSANCLPDQLWLADSCDLDSTEFSDMTYLLEKKLS